MKESEIAELSKELKEIDRKLSTIIFLMTKIVSNKKKEGK